jgi:hypothetical protein
MNDCGHTPHGLTLHYHFRKQKGSSGGLKQGFLWVGRVARLTRTREEMLEHNKQS